MTDAEREEERKADRNGFLKACFWFQLQKELQAWTEEHPNQERSYSLLRIPPFECGSPGWKVMVIAKLNGKAYPIGFEWCERCDGYEGVLEGLRIMRDQLHRQIREANLHLARQGN